MKRFIAIAFAALCGLVFLSSSAAAGEVLRLTLQLSDVGDGKFRIEKTAQPAADDLSGTPFNFSTWPHTKATKGKKGVFRLVHDFSDPDDLNVLAFDKPLNVTLDKQAGGMVFTPGPDAKTGAVFYYGKKWKLPFKIQCDVADLGGGFAIRLGDPTRKLGILQCSLASTASDGPFEAATQWLEIGTGGKPRTSTLHRKKDVTLNEPFEMPFQLPLPKTKINKAFQLELCKESGKSPTKVARLEVQGQIALIFGLALTGKQGVIVAQSIAPNSLAEKAGFQTSDVLTAINGKRFQSAVEAVDTLSRLPVGEEAKFTILRAKQKQELRVVAE
jgi:hypothetical protein